MIEEILTKTIELVNYQRYSDINVTDLEGLLEQI